MPTPCTATVRSEVTVGASATATPSMLAANSAAVVVSAAVSASFMSPALPRRWPGTLLQSNLFPVGDPFTLSRFEEAQAGVYERVVLELQAGRKRSHWMWFVFPQLQGLGRSPMSQKYAISSLAEARAYLEHPVLGERLVHCTRIVCELRGRTAEDVFGATDATKLRSSM